MDTENKAITIPQLKNSIIQSINHNVAIRHTIVTLSKGRTVYEVSMYGVFSSDINHILPDVNVRGVQIVKSLNPNEPVPITVFIITDQLVFELTCQITEINRTAILFEF